MSKHIKTGEEVFDQIGLCYGKGYSKLLKEKWVSLSWLKEQIEQTKKKDKLREYTYDHVLSLLEEK